MRIVFCGTPEFAVPTLRSLLVDSDFTVDAVITQPDRPSGRGGAVSPCPVKQVALDAGVCVYQPEKIRAAEAHDLFARLAPDAVVIIAYGQIIPARLIGVPRLGWINLHASLLPEYRGAAPIAWAIANGERVTGLTTMTIDAGMDTGAILLQREFEIGSDETAPELGRRLSEGGPTLMAESLKKLNRGEISPQPQDGALATYAPILNKEHGRIDWSSAPRQIYDRMRGFAPWPGAYTLFREKRCHIWGHPNAGSAPHQAVPSPHAASTLAGTILVESDAIFVVCGAGDLLRLDEIQLEGRKRITAREFANGAHIASGERFGA